MCESELSWCRERIEVVRSQVQVDRCDDQGVAADGKVAVEGSLGRWPVLTSEGEIEADANQRDMCQEEADLGDGSLSVHERDGRSDTLWQQDREVRQVQRVAQVQARHSLVLYPMRLDGAQTGTFGDVGVQGQRIRCLIGSSKTSECYHKTVSNAAKSAVFSLILML